MPHGGGAETTHNATQHTHTHTHTQNAGDSLPVLTPDATRARLAPLVESGYNFVTCSAGDTGLRPTGWHEVRRWRSRRRGADARRLSTVMKERPSSRDTRGRDGVARTDVASQP